MRKTGIKGLFITKLNYCLLFHFHLFFFFFFSPSFSFFSLLFFFFFVLLPYHYMPANILTYKRCRHIKLNLLSLLIYSVKLSLMKLQVCHNFISFFILKIVTECLEEIFKKLLSL